MNQVDDLVKKNQWKHKEAWWPQERHGQAYSQWQKNLGNVCKFWYHEKEIQEDWGFGWGGHGWVCWDCWFNYQA